MIDDIVTRLRVPLPWNLAGMTTKQLGDERRDAADEIESLRKALKVRDLQILVNNKVIDAMYEELYGND